MPKFDENKSVHVWIQANVKVFFLFFFLKHDSTVLSFEYSIDKIK